MKSGRPVLYELLKTPPSSNGYSSQNGRHSREEPVHEAAPEPEARERPVFGNGRTIRLPAGYIFVFIAVLILCAAVAYMFGYMRGEQEGELSELDRLVAEQENSLIGSQLGTNDSDASRAPGGSGLTERPSPPTGRNDTGSRPRDGNRGSGTAASGSPSNTSNGSAGGQPRTYHTPVEPTKDPREPGHYYYRLIATSRTMATTVAEFCRENGVEAFILRANNGGSYTVYVLPGFTSEERDSPGVKALEEQIDNVRTLWHAKVGRNELVGYFPAFHSGTE